MCLVRQIMRALLLSVAVLLAACGSDRRPDGTPPTNADAGTDAGFVDAGLERDAGVGRDAGTDPTTEPSDLGRVCPGGCNLATCVLENEDCEGGICVWHGALGAAYCSRRCVTTCRAGYTCQQTEDDSGPACLSDTPTCGNDVVEFGEACDDGNTAAGDFCAPDCSTTTTPPSGGTVTTSFDGRPPMTAMGDDPVVYATKMGTDIFFGANTSEVTYRIALPDDAGPAPFATLMEVGLIENAGGNLCPYSGATRADITRLDRAANEIQGSAALLMVCMGGNCEFGCNPQFMLEVGFDLRWTEE